MIRRLWRRLRGHREVYVSLFDQFDHGVDRRPVLVDRRGKSVRQVTFPPRPEAFIVKFIVIEEPDGRSKVIDLDVDATVRRGAKARVE